MISVVLNQVQNQTDKKIQRKMKKNEEERVLV
jgi:hypothetical protein